MSTYKMITFLATVVCALFCGRTLGGEILFEGDLTAYFRTQGESVGACVAYAGRTALNGDHAAPYDNNEASFGIAHAFDGIVGDQNSRYMTTLSQIAIEYGVAMSYAADHEVVVTNITIWCPPGSANPSRAPKKFNLCGYDDDKGEWILLGEWVTETFAEGESRAFLVPAENRAPYRIYRFLNKAVQGKNQPFCVNEVAFGGYIRKRTHVGAYDKLIYSGDVTRYFREKVAGGTATVSISSFRDDDETPTSGETLGDCTKAFDGPYSEGSTRWGANIIPSYLHYEVSSDILSDYDIVIQKIEVLPSFSCRNLTGFELQGYYPKRNEWKTLVTTEDYHSYTQTDLDEFNRYAVTAPDYSWRGITHYRLHLTKPKGGTGSGYFVDVGEVVLFGQIVRREKKGLAVIVR